MTRMGWVMVLAGVLGAGGVLAQEGHEGHSQHGMKHGMKQGGKHMSREKHGAMKAEKEGKVVTLEGEVVDLSCYMGHGAKGEKHRNCAKSCLLEGIPAGILIGDGKVYLLLEDHSKKSFKKAFKAVKRLASRNVEVRGKVVMKGGLQALLLRSIEKKGK